MRKYADCPGVVRDFLSYHENIKAQSPRTIAEYHLDLRMFLRFVKLMRKDMPIIFVLYNVFRMCLCWLLLMKMKL